MAQWESARVEAEARFVREMKSVSKPPLDSSPTQLTNKGWVGQARKECPDVLKAWQGVASGMFGITKDSLESPASTFNIQENTPINPTFGLIGDNVVVNLTPCFEEPNHMQGWKENMSKSMALHEMMYSTDQASMAENFIFGGLSDIMDCDSGAQNSSLNGEYSNAAPAYNGSFEDDKNYWNKKDTFPNAILSGFDVIEDIKAEPEKECPGIVSCADIVALAARDSVSYQFKKPMWKVLTGRRDGRVSLASEFLNNIPSPFFNFTELKPNFKSRGLTVHDLVVLSGAHTVGIGRCKLFSNKLYNFTGKGLKGGQDPSLDPVYADFLKTKCRSLSDTTTTVKMDPGSSLDFDTNYYVTLKQNKGLFQSDAAVLTNKGASNIVSELMNQNKFFTEFAQSMKRMGAIGVLKGTKGEIRKKCSVVN
ncbi:hypothetical protein Pint_01083 [Pistacia integerrima]|uniref:Uncharacterized protein n=1 Tax=Pistacia integerrima TaxID=434235 RepID=A0ACC0ZH76_9ROSI|nr:hypothetical protein Pint_01083 [Pistacia integerrima]